MVPGSLKSGYSRNNRIFFLNVSCLCHPNILAIVALSLQMSHIYFPKMSLLFSKNVFASANIIYNESLYPN